MMNRREAIWGLFCGVAGAAITGLSMSGSKNELVRDVARFTPPDAEVFEEINVFATDQTRKNFPIIQQMPEWLVGSIGTVYVVGPKDFDTPAMRKAITAVRNINNEKSGLTEALQYVTNPENQAVLFEEAKATLTQLMGSSRFVDHMPENDLRDFVINLISGSPTTRRQNWNITKPANDIALITTSYADATKEEIATTYTGLPLKAIKNIPGTHADWRAKGIIHEACHAGHAGSETTLAEETRTDLDAGAVYDYELERGNVTTAELNGPEQELRAIGSVITFEASEHMINAAIQSGNESFSPVGSERDFKTGLLFLQEKVTSHIGQIYTGQTHFAVPLHNILNFQPAYEGHEVLTLSAADEQMVRDMLQSLTQLNMTGFDESLAKLSPTAKTKIEEILKTSQAGVGSFLAQYNAPLLYKTVAELYQATILDENPVAKQYAYEFLVAAPKYAPDHFKTDAVADRNFVPPVFDDQGIAVPALQVEAPPTPAG